MSKKMEHLSLILLVHVFAWFCVIKGLWFNHSQYLGAFCDIFTGMQPYRNEHSNNSDTQFEEQHKKIKIKLFNLTVNDEFRLSQVYYYVNEFWCEWLTSIRRGYQFFELFQIWLEFWVVLIQQIFLC